MNNITGNLRIQNNGTVKSAQFEVDQVDFNDSANSAVQVRKEPAGNLKIFKNLSVVGVSTFTGIAQFANTINLNHASAGQNYIYFNEDLQLAKNGTGTRLKIDSSGRVVIGHTSNIGIANHNGRFQLHGTDYDTATMSIVHNGTDSFGPFLLFASQRSGSPGGSTVLQNNDAVGTIRFHAGDGTDMASYCAAIQVKIDGTPGSNDVPGRITCSTTADGASSPTERVRINKDGNVMITGKGASINHGQTSQLVPLFLKTSTNLTAFDTAEGASSDGLFRIEDGASEDRYHGIELRNRSGGDIRILNHDRNTSNAGDLVIAQYSSDAGQGLKEKIRLSGVYDAVHIAGKGGASINSNLGENVQKTDIYITTKSELTDPTMNAGGELAGVIRFHETGNNNSRYHGIEFRNKNSGDVRILNQATDATNFANMVFVTDNGSQTTQRMIINGNGNIGAPSGNNIYNASDERLKENIVELTDGLNKIYQLKPVSFTWKEGWDPDLDGLTQYGFGAHQVKSVDEILVESFGEKEITLNGETIDNPLRVNEKHVIPLLVKAIQELSAKVAALEG